MHGSKVMEAAIPESFYTILGILVFMSAGSIVGGIVMIVRVALWVGEYKQRMSEAEKDINAQFSKIREIEKLKGK